MNTRHMQQGPKGPIADVVAVAILLADGTPITPHAMVLEADGQYYGNKQPYVTPNEVTIASYSQTPEGYEVVYTEPMARHGSCGLLSYKYDVLPIKMTEAAETDSGFRSGAIKPKFMKDLKAITTINVEDGYGMLTGRGADQYQGIGARAYERNRTLLDNAVRDGDKIVYQSSGEARATESGENFTHGFDAASNNKLANNIVTPVDPAGTGKVTIFNKTPNTLYSHKSGNPGGTEKTDEAKQRADDYQNFVENDAITAGAEQIIAENEDAKTVSYDLLSQIFIDDFLARLADGTYIWYSTAGGTKGGEANCVSGADPGKDADACGTAKKKIASEHDAAVDLYDLYIVAANMENENTGSHTLDFSQCFRSEQADDTKPFAWALDTEDFYEKDPNYVGQDETYTIAQPLFDDFFSSIDEHVNGGSTVATFRFTHVETMMPFATLLGLPGSIQQAATSTTGVYTYANNEWRDELMTPVAASV